MRFEATRSFFKTIILHGPDSPEEAAIITRVNQIHKDMGIDPTAPAFSFVLYTLSRVFIHSLRRNGAHVPSCQEELALYRLMRRVGEKMGANHVPTSYADFIESHEHFKRNCWATASATSEAVARSLIHNALSHMPRFIRLCARTPILSLVSEETLEQLRLRRPSPLVRAAMRVLLWSIA